MRTAEELAKNCVSKSASIGSLRREAVKFEVA